VLPRPAKEGSTNRIFLSSDPLFNLLAAELNSTFFVSDYPAGIPFGGSGMLEPLVESSRTSEYEASPICTIPLSGGPNIVLKDQFNILFLCGGLL